MPAAHVSVLHALREMSEFRRLGAARGLKPMRAVKILGLVLIVALATTAHADVSLPSPLRAQDVVALARSRRAEIVAAKARARAASQRPAIVSALEDPALSFSVDHASFGHLRRNNRSRVGRLANGGH